MIFRILGLGTALPPHRMTQEQSTALAKQVICRDDREARLLTALYQKAGVRCRYTVLPHEIALNWMPSDGVPRGYSSAEQTLGPTTGERMAYYAQHAAPLARTAARQALEDAAVESVRITHLVTVSCTGFSAPGVELDLIKSLNLRPTTERIHIGYMGCHGAINGLRCARAFAVADPHAMIMLCAVELCSLHYRFHWDPPRIVANALFGDGAAAVIGVGGLAADATHWNVVATASCLLPDSQDAMSWKIGDHGFEMTLAATVPDLIHAHLRDWLAAWLNTQRQSIASIGSWAIHPGGPRILSACAEALSLSSDKVAVSEQVLSEYGNMSSPTVLFILDQLRRKAAPRPCVALAFGPGLIAEAALLN